MPIAPWSADSLDHVRDAVSIQPIYSVELVDYFWFTGQNPWLVKVPEQLRTVPAWNVEVDLDGGRAPYGRAQFSAPLDYISPDPITLSPAPGAGVYPTFTPLERLHPYRGVPVRIKAGYQRAGGPDLHTLFVGYITARRYRRDSSGAAYLEFTAETSETMFMQPSSRAGNVVNTWTSVKQGCDAIAGYATPWYRRVVVAEEAGQMNTPTSGQLTNWRSWTYSVGDDVLETVVTWAIALGQWLRGDPRTLGSMFGAGAMPQLLISADPYPYRAVTTLPTSLFTDLDRLESLDQWANILNLTVTGNGQTKQAHYLGAGVYQGSPIPNGQIRTKDVTIHVTPPSTLPTDYPPAIRWLNRIGPAQEARWVASSRAMYWLQPRIDAITLSDDDLGDTAAAIDAITWHLDTGTQTMTWAADATYKP